MISMPDTETAKLCLVPMLLTEDSGPFHPLHNRALKLSGGEQRQMRVQLMSAWHVHIMGEAKRATFTARVPDDAKSAANFVTLHRYTSNGPWEPDFISPILVRPGEMRKIEVSNEQALHCHEIILVHG
jgi:hypothetical protein